jgi:hypothetical protein
LRSLIALTIALGLTAATAQAQQVGIPVIIHGAGGSSCGKYVEAYEPITLYRREKREHGRMASHASYWQFEEWIDGYTSGMEARGKRPLRDWDGSGMRVWMYNYCQQHPVDVVWNAAFHFFKELGGD